MKGPSSFTSFLTFHVLLSLLTLLLSSSLEVCSAAGSQTSAEFIKASCGATSYPRVCFKSLFAYASAIQTSPKQLVHTALEVSLAEARSTSIAVSNMSKVLNMKPREKAAMKDCIETVADSVYELKRSITEMGNLSGPEFEATMNNIQTWVSAALTDDDTCMDGFEYAKGSIRNDVRSRVLRVAQLTSNALALVNRLDSTAPTKN